MAKKGTSELAAGAFVAAFFAGDAESAEYGFARFSAPPQAAFFNENGILQECEMREERSLS